MLTLAPIITYGRDRLELCTAGRDCTPLELHVFRQRRLAVLPYLIQTVAGHRSQKEDGHLLEN